MDRALANVERVLVAGGFAVLFFVLPHALEGDDVFRYEGIKQLLEHGHLVGGRRSLWMPLASVPVLELGHVVESRSWWALRFNVIVVALGALVVWRLLRDRVDATVLRRSLLVLLFASFLTNRLRSYDPAVLVGTLVAIGVACVATRRHVAAGWAGMAFGAAMVPAFVVALVPLSALDAWRSRRLRPFLWLGVSVALVAAENWARRGGPLDTGYGGDHGYRTLLPYSGRPGFSYPFVLGVASLLFSFGRGLLFFTPGLTLWVDRRVRTSAGALRAVLVPLLVVVAALVLVYAKWWAWYGGITWGPRFLLLAALPASILIALRLSTPSASVAANVFLLGVLALSAWVGYTGATSDYTQFRFCIRDHYALESFCWFEPTQSGLWWPVLHAPRMNASRTFLAAWCALVFATLALPLLRSLAVSVRAVRLDPTWARGWRL